MRKSTSKDAELQFLVDQLEEESNTDTDYWVDEPTIQMLEDDGAPKSLVDLLRSGLAGRDGFDVQWSRG